MTEYNEQPQVQQEGVLPNQTEQPQYEPGSAASETPSSGYMRSQADKDRDARHEELLGLTNNTPEETNPDIQELSEKLGVNPEDIGKEPTPEPEEPKQDYVDPEDWYAQQFNEEKAQQFAEDFKKYVGIDIKEVYGLIKNTAEVTKYVDDWRQQAVAEQQVNKLKQEFGQEYDTLMPQVLERFGQIKKANPQQGAALDNPDGARLIAALIRQERMQGKTQIPPATKDVPTYFPNRRQVNHGRESSPVIKMSEMITWTGEEMDRRYADIVLAKRNGTFVYDV